MKKVVQVFHSFAEAEAADKAYYRSLSPEERIDILLEMIARHQADEGKDSAEFQRVYRIRKLGDD